MKDTYKIKAIKNDAQHAGFEMIVADKNSSIYSILLCFDEAYKRLNRTFGREKTNQLITDALNSYDMIQSPFYGLTKEYTSVALPRTIQITSKG